MRSTTAWMLVGVAWRWRRMGPPSPSAALEVKLSRRTYKQACNGRSQHDSIHSEECF